MNISPQALPEAVRGHSGAVAGRLRSLSGILQRIFSRGPIPLLAPHLKISFGSVRKKHPLSALEIGAGLVESGGRTVLMFARLRSWIETAMLAVWSGLACVVRKHRAPGRRPLLVTDAAHDN
jgi:hypothetical protein